MARRDLNLSNNFIKVRRQRRSRGGNWVVGKSVSVVRWCPAKAGSFKEWEKLKPKFIVHKTFKTQREANKYADYLHLQFSDFSAELEASYRSDDGVFQWNNGVNNWCV